MSVSTAEEIKFSDELLAFIEEWKTKPGNLIMILHKVQGEFERIDDLMERLKGQQPCNFPIWDVRHVCFSKERQHVVFA